MGPESQILASVSPINRSQAIGHVVSATGSQAVVMLDRESNENIGKRAELGAILKVDTPSAIILGLVSALSIPVPAQRDGEPEVRVAELELIGQLMRNDDGSIGSFLRGVTGYPSLGDPVDVATGDELRGAYLRNDAQSVSIGTLTQDRSIPAMVQVDELLGKHCAILGSTGTGKSCGVAVLLRAILDQNKRAHILLLDPHNEYAECFGDRAEVITPDDLHLPFWLLTFEEMLEVVIGNSAEKSAEAEILAELIPVAKWRYATNRGRDTAALMKRGINAGQIRSFTVDTPVPYRISDVIAIIDERMGRLENRRDLAPYRQLKTRLEAISGDPRYAFMFGSLTVQDHMAAIVGRLFRVPVQNKPIAILELTGVPSEIVNVVVSVICRMTFDFALWSGGTYPSPWFARRRTATCPTMPTSGSSRRAGQSRGLPRRAENTVSRCASSASVRRNSTRRSCHSATRSSRCACPMSATRTTSGRRFLTPRRACSIFSPPWAPERQSSSGTASHCRDVSVSRTSPSMQCREAERRASRKSGSRMTGRPSTSTRWSSVGGRRTRRSCTQACRQTRPRPRSRSTYPWSRA